MIEDTTTGQHRECAGEPRGDKAWNIAKHGLALQCVKGFGLVDTDTDPLATKKLIEELKLAEIEFVMMSEVVKGSLLHLQEALATWLAKADKLLGRSGWVPCSWVGTMGNRRDW
eukprot:TRINITY_DN23544_c0_g1_i1.p3 TRINITY_DN23544_c0_g1~~TRINITY_DN23544_c0_g1_i1.p3  ORF type:complete len:114 (+),score=17.05 TRINITY_DN23544_c0_g1_i1:104-445(+)